MDQLRAIQSQCTEGMEYIEKGPNWNETFGDFIKLNLKRTAR